MEFGDGILTLLLFKPLGLNNKNQRQKKGEKITHILLIFVFPCEQKSQKENVLKITLLGHEIVLFIAFFFQVESSNVAQVNLNIWVFLLWPPEC